MIEIGADILTQLAEGQIHHAKLVFNDRGFIAFPTRIQHSTMKAEGISYEDNDAGNALAAILKPGAIEVRFHRDFGDEAVAHVSYHVARDHRPLHAPAHRGDVPGPADRRRTHVTWC